MTWRHSPSVHALGTGVPCWAQKCKVVYKWESATKILANCGFLAETAQQECINVWDSHCCLSMVSTPYWHIHSHFNHTCNHFPTSTELFSYDTEWCHTIIVYKLVCILGKTTQRLGSCKMAWGNYCKHSIISAYRMWLYNVNIPFLHNERNYRFFF